MRGFAKNPSRAIAICSIGIVGTAFLLPNSALTLFITAASLGVLFYSASLCGSRLAAVKVLILTSVLFALIAVSFRALLYVPRPVPPEYWLIFHRIYRAMWLTQCSAIVIALCGAGLAIIEGVNRFVNDAIRKRFQWSMIGASSILVATNVAHFMRPVWCADCF